MFDPIVIGCSWLGVVNVYPRGMMTDDDVTALLTGATVDAMFYAEGGSALVVATTQIDPTARTVGLSLTPTQTAPLGPQAGCWLDVRIQTADARVLPVAVKAVVSVVRGTPSA